MGLDLVDNPANLANVLGMLSVNDTETIKNGEKLLKPALKQPLFLMSLLNQIKQSPALEIRHHAALLLKKKLTTHFRKVGPNNQNILKVELLQTMKSESVKAVSISLAGCVALLAKAMFSVGSEWPELFQSILELSQSPNEALRCLNFSLLEQLAEHVSENLRPHTPTLVQMFLRGCEDTSINVATAAMHATSMYIGALSDVPEVMELKVLITPLMTVLNKCLQNGDELVVAEGLDVFQECVTMKQPLINDHLEVLIPFLASILQNTNLDSPVRKSAGQTLISIMECRPKLVAKKQLVAPSIQVLATIIAHSNESAAGSLFSFTETKGTIDEAEPEDEEDEVDMQRIAHICIDVMAVNIPSKFFVDAALSVSAQGLQSTDPNMRKAGCAILGIIAEGCCDSIRQNLPKIMPAILASANDNEKVVKETAYFALGQFSEHCQPEILHYHQSVLPVLYAALDDERYTVQTTCCYVIEMFCENLQRETLRPYLQPLLQKLALILQSPKEVTQVMALSAISSTALAAESDFLPYVHDLVASLQTKLFSTEQISLRGRSLECLGHIGVSIGNEHFAPYFDIGMQSAQQGIAMDDDDLKEYAYVFYANTSKAMGKKFVPYLPTIVPHLISVILESELYYDEEDEEGEGGHHEGDEHKAMGDHHGDEDDDEDDNQTIRINGRDGYINSKKAAITALASIAQYCLEDFAPYLGESLRAILCDQGPLVSYHDIIRAEGFESLQFLVMAGAAANGIHGAPANYTTLPLPESLAAIVQSCMKSCLEGIREDAYKLIVAKCIESISGMLNIVGNAALHLGLEDNKLIGQHLMECIELSLMQKLECQTNELEQEDEGGEDDHDNLVMDDVTDLIGILAKVMGPNFIHYFDSMLPHLMKYANNDRIHSDRSMVIGCLAEVIGEIGGHAEKYINLVLPLIATGLRDEMEGVRRNSAFCLVTLIQSTGKALQPKFMEILSWLYPLCTRTAEQQAFDTGGADIDNALSAVAKMITIAPEILPIPQILPVMLASLPLRADNSEGPSVYGSLCLLLTEQNPAAAPFFRDILIALAQMLLPDSKAVDDTKAIILSTLKTLHTAPHIQPQLLATIAAIEDPIIQNILTTAITC